MCLHVAVQQAMAYLAGVITFVTSVVVVSFICFISASPVPLESPIAKNSLNASVAVGFLNRAGVVAASLRELARIQ